jgi:hypothetical protein
MESWGSAGLLLYNFVQELEFWMRRDRGDLLQTREVPLYQITSKFQGS